MEGYQLFLAVTFIVILFYVISLFNTMVDRKNRVQFAFAGIDAMLKKRFDLIPNLVSAVERYMQHEQEVLWQLTSIRSRAVAGSIETENLVDINNQLTATLRTLFAISESYPLLRASDNFLHLQGALNETEEQISAARRAYNAAVTDYNNGCEQFPLNLAACHMGYRQKQWFEIPDAERQAVNLKGMWS
jgi:LemA protein